MYQSLKDSLKAGGFIGQEKAVNKLSLFAEELKAGGNFNILFIGEAGFGKTTLALQLLRYLNPEEDDSEVLLPDNEGKYYLEANYRYHFLDEIHQIAFFEGLYHLMEDNIFSLFFASNFYDILPQPFVDRCEHIVLTRYSKEELSEILFRVFKSNKIELDPKFCYTLTDYTRGIPRICKNMGNRLSFAFTLHGIPNTEEELHEFMFDFYGLEKGGYTQQDILYLTFLQEIGGRASLQRIISGTQLPRKTVEQYIEPFLLKNNKIKITNQGRILTYG